MKDSRPPEIRALDDTCSELDRQITQALALADDMCVDRAELERLHQVATTARLACTSFVLEAGTAMIMQRRMQERRTVTLQ
ncbi:hypothetical protein [Shinella kummerowiae]|uniref:hypothetical protein n=1 Tax=Shinella kummerowiae TaxID=417745 RepID=UPI0021B52AA5|nr:hypothetical protein [Shinella kummerowiae]MCT7662356.1 hypothetical protein [Shinella kummerowiae]